MTSTGHSPDVIFVVTNFAHVLQCLLSSRVRATIRGEKEFALQAVCAMHNSDLPTLGVGLVRPQLLPLLVRLPDQLVDVVLCEVGIRLHVCDGCLRGPVVLKVGAEVIVMCLFPLTPVWLHEPSQWQVFVSLPTIL